MRPFALVILSEAKNLDVSLRVTALLSFNICNLKIRVCCCRMLGIVKPLILLFLCNSQTNCLFNEHKDSVGNKKCPDKRNNTAEQLDTDIVEVKHLSCLEHSECHSPPHTTDPMHGYSTDRVVYLQPVKLNNREDNNNPCNNPCHNCPYRLYISTTRSNCNKTG